MSILRTHMRRLVEWQWFINGITVLIIVNFFTILAGTEGIDLEVVEVGILLIFTAEVSLKLFVYGVRGWAKSGWNLFDFIIVTLGLLPLLGVPLPEGFSGARALRLIRLLGRIPATRVLIEAIFSSAKQLGGVFLLCGLCMIIFSLMATQSFQMILPQHFGSFGQSFKSLLAICALSGLDVIAEAWEKSVAGTLLVFPGFIISVPITGFNLVIGVLSNALTKVEKGRKEIAELREENEGLKAQIAVLTSALAKKDGETR